MNGTYGTLEDDVDSIINRALTRLTKDEYLQVLLLEIECTKGFITYWQSSVVSGHCKNRKITKGNGQALTSDELVADAMSTLQVHCHRLCDLTDLYKRVLRVGRED